MLEFDDRILAKIRNIGHTRLSSRLDDHPADVRPEKAVVCSIGVEIGVGVSVMSTMAAGPPVDGTLNGTGAHQGKEVFKWLGGIVRSVRPQTVVACRDAQTRKEVVCACPCKCSPLEWCSEDAVDGQDGCDGEDDEADPLNLAEDILPLDRWQRWFSFQCASDVVVWDVAIGKC